MKNKMSLKDWQAALDAERAKGLRRGSTLPKQAADYAEDSIAAKRAARHPEIKQQHGRRPGLDLL